MGCGGTKNEMTKNEIIDWVKKENIKFHEEYDKEEKVESEKMMQTLKKGMSNAIDPLTEGLKAMGDYMHQNIEVQINQKNYLESFNEIEILLLKSEYNNLNIAQDIFSEYLKLKQTREFGKSNSVMEKFRKYINENDKNESNRNKINDIPQANNIVVKAAS